MSSRGAFDSRGTLGEWNAICDLCGRRFKASVLRENWKGLRVCREDWEPRHSMDFFRLPGEKISVPFARSDDKPEKFGADAPAICTNTTRAGIVGIGVVGCMIVGTDLDGDSTFPIPASGVVTKA